MSTPRTIDVPTLRARLETDAPRILDVRTPSEFESTHIPGSYNVPLDLLREHRAELTRHLDDEFVLVCRSGARAEQAEKALGDAGTPGLRVLAGGIARWEAEGAPLRRGRQAWELERQVRLLAGSLVAGSVAGSAVLSPRLKWVAGAIGAGLAGAAITDTCAMGMALSRMPWNRRGSVDFDNVLSDLASDQAARS